MTVPPNWLGVVGKLRRAKLEIEMAIESIESGEGAFTAVAVTNRAEAAGAYLRDVYGLLPKKNKPDVPDSIVAASPYGTACFMMSNGRVERVPAYPGVCVSVPEGTKKAWVEYSSGPRTIHNRCTLCGEMDGAHVTWCERY